MTQILSTWGLGLCAPVKTHKPKAHPEKDVQKTIQQVFRLQHNISLIHVDAGGAGFRRGQAAGAGGHSETPIGFPDLLGVIPPQGRAIFIEVKAPGNKPSEAQTRMLDMLRLKGAIAFWADSAESALQQFRDATRRTA